jgi:hypothetical protein
VADAKNAGPTDSDMRSPGIWQPSADFAVFSLSVFLLFYYRIIY